MRKVLVFNILDGTTHTKKIRVSGFADHVQYNIGLYIQSYGHSSVANQLIEHIGGYMEIVNMVALNTSSVISVTMSNLTSNSFDLDFTDSSPYGGTAIFDIIYCDDMDSLKIEVVS